jgi:Flp pilus assembly protein TadG
MLRRVLGRLAKETSAAVAPTVALSLIGLVAAGGLAFDYARMAAMDTELQNAADQAALAAARQLDQKDGACGRAALAASALVSNDTLFANEYSAYPGVTINVVNEGACDAAGTIRFYQDKAKTTAADNFANARFVQVQVATRRANYAFTAIISALFQDLTAYAFAGVGSAICKVPPLMMCNPSETGGNTSFNVADFVGKGILAKEGGGGAWAPGNFGFLDVGSGASADSLRDVFGLVNTTHECVTVNGVATAPGNMAAVSAAINTRFDIYASGWAQGCGTENCPPAFNTVKDLVRPNAGASAASCDLSNSGWREVAADEQYLPDPVTRTDANVTAMGHPRDICHAISNDGDCAGGVVGDGNWDRDTYFRVNHGFATTTAWQAAVGLASPTRYQTYEWEISSGNLGMRAVGGLASYKAPVCATAGGVGPPDKADRRKASLAVINCKAEKVKGRLIGVEVEDWIDIFLVEPSIDRSSGRTKKDQIYIEVIGATTTAGNNQPQLVRRDVPYLIE